MDRRSHTRGASVPVFEAMEPRLLLDGNPIITEFLADNSGGLQDQFGRTPDWIEIYNPTTDAVNLLGWHLTDDLEDLDQWTFPDVTILAGEYMVVFASGDNLRDASQPLHTNFGLGKSGDSLALVKPNAQTIDIVSSYTFGPQEENVSYGIYPTTTVTPLVSAGVLARTLVPTGDIGTTWTQYGYSDASWIQGSDKKTGVGFEVNVPGFSVTRYKASVSVTNLTQAETVIATPSQQSGTYALNDPLINYMDTSGGGHYGADAPFPGYTIGLGLDNYVVRATGKVYIPTAGPWTFGVSSNDGFGLSLTNGVDTFSMSYPGVRAAGDTLAVFNVLAPGWYDARLVYFENTGGAELEFFAAPGTHAAWDTDFRLVGDTAGGGLEVHSDPVVGGAGSTSFLPLISTNVGSTMMDHNSSVYVRVPFTVTNPATWSSLALRMRYDDGFVVYLNGVEVARRNAPAGTPAWNAAATTERDNAKALVTLEINLSNRAGLLQVGTNILAIHGLNSSASDGDLLVLPELANVVVSGWVEHFFGTPTPEAANSSNFIAHVSDTKFSVDRGFYDTAFTVAITCTTPSSSIYYTTNGSAPSSTNGTRYTTPVAINTTTTLRAIAVRTGWTSSDIDTQTYIFLDNVLTQVRPSPYPTSWGAAQADYDMDPNVVTNPAYAATIKADLLAVPTMSIVMNINDMFGPSGIYSNTWEEGEAWERACSVEYLYADGTTGFQENAGLRIYGGVGRDPAIKKHSLRLIFKDIYGDTKLNYDFFDDSEVDQFDTLVLRANFNDAWPGYWLGNQSQYMRDRWASETQLAMGQPSSHGNWVHLYINGLYWGLYNPVERPDATFAASYLGGDKADYDAINSYPQQPINGDSVAWNTMMSLANAGVTTDAQYQAIQQYVDVVNLADYVVLNHYLSNWDWDDHNWYAARKREPGATFKFFSWDAEWVMYSDVLNSDYTGTNLGDRPSHLFAQLMGNAEFKMLFADRVYKWCFNDGVLTPAAGQALWMQIAGEIDRAVVGESARWGDVQREPPFTRDGDWIPQQNWVMNTWFPARTNTLLTQYRNKAWYPSAAAPTFNKHGGVVQTGYKLTMTGSGTIYYTTDGTDPRLAGGTVSGSAQVYTSSGVIISDSKVIRARVLYGGAWSALHEAAFYIDATPGLRVTEIMYNPAAPTLAEMSLGFTDRDDFEYIELQNIGATTINLFGVRFAAGVDVTLPVAYVASGQYGLLVRNQAAFEARYGTGLSGLIVGTYDGRLDDGGEPLRLEYAVGGIIQEFTYKDGWYDQTDGQGFSLVIRDPLADRTLWDTKDGWKASWAFGGNPGAGDTGYNPGSIIISELLTHSDAIDGDWIELYNTTGGAIDIGGWFISDSADNLASYRIAPGTTLEGYGYLVLTQVANFGVDAADPGRLHGFGFSELGETAYLTSVDPAGLPGGFRVVQPFGASDREVTFGLYTKSTGGTDFVAMAAATPWDPNSLPAVGPIVINEVMYNPAVAGYEFIELYNITGADVPLYDNEPTANYWKFTDGIDFTFPAGAYVPAHGYALVVGVTPAAFRAANPGVPAAVQIYGPYTGLLENAGETIELSKPGFPEPITGFVPYVRAERVTYDSQAPWPMYADGLGYSLQRNVSADYGNDVANWHVAPPLGGTPGLVNTVPPPPARLTAVRYNDIYNRTVSAIEPSGVGVRTIQITFDQNLFFTASSVVIQKVTFEGNTETLGAVVVPPYVTGNSTNVMTITFDTAVVVDTWVKVRLRADTFTDLWNQTLDGEAKAGGSGRGYVYSAAADLPTGDGVAGGDTLFYVGSLRGDMRGVGFFGFAPDGIVNTWDINGFTSKYTAGNLDADMRGVGFFQPNPDGLLNVWDINGFTSVYNAAIRYNRHLDPLPTLLGGPLASGLPQPLEVVVHDPLAATLDRLAPADPAAADLAPPLATATSEGALGDGLTVSADATAPPVAWTPTDAAAPADATLSPDGGLVDLLAQPALEVALGA